MKEELLKKIKEIVDGEKLALDSFFFCGSGSSVPDTELIEAGEKYLQSVHDGNPDTAARDKMIERLEAAASKKPEVLKARASVQLEDARNKVILSILQSKELL